MKAWTIHVPDDPARQGWVKAQRAALDPIPLETVEDKLRLGCLPTVMRAWERAARTEGITWHLFLSDDMTFTTSPGFHLAQLAQLDAAYISLFCSKNSQVERALAKSQQWLRGSGTIYGAAYLLHHSLVTDLYEHASAWMPHLEADYQHDDGIIYMWAQKQHIPCWATVPSIVQHSGYDRSLLGHHGRTIARYTASGPITWSAPDDTAPVATARLGGPSIRQIARLTKAELL